MTKHKKSKGSQAKHDVKTGKATKEAARVAASVPEAPIEIPDAVSSGDETVSAPSTPQPVKRRRVVESAELAPPRIPPIGNFAPVAPVQVAVETTAAPAPPTREAAPRDPRLAMLTSSPDPATLSARQLRYNAFIDEQLRIRGYPPLAEMSNEALRAKYSPCDYVSHALSLWEEYKRDRSFNQVLNLVPGDECRNCSGLASPYSDLTYDCRACGTHFELSVGLPRIVAVLSLPMAQLWKAVLPFQTALKAGRAAKPLFECSGRCNENNGPANLHCINAKHLVMEPTMYNAERKSHHHGDKPCWCPLHCLRSGEKSKWLHYEVTEVVPAVLSVLHRRQ